MSSHFSVGDAPAQRLPAWKRLGLKLKPASDEAATLPTSTAAPSVPNHHRENPTGPGSTNAKRKSSGVPALDHSAKKAKRDAAQNQFASTHQTPKKQKSVSFAADSSQDAGSPATANRTQPSKRKKQTPTKKSAPAPAKQPLKKQAPVNLEPALAYLRQWHTSKDTWKFNKNNQTKLLEQVFADNDTIPAADIHVFYQYIQGLKGAVRTRLKELASGIKAEDMEQGPGGFPASSKEMAERKQKEYLEVIAAFLGQPRTPGKRRFEEVDYVLRTSDMEMQRRVVKRMRCEMVLDELSDSETETEVASTTTATTSSTEKGDTAVDSEDDAMSETATDGAEGVKRLRLNDGPLQRVKRKRKTRTAVVDDETSSESDSDSDESDSDAGSSSSGSSSSDDSDDETLEPQLRAEDETSSSSSSSSDEASDSDSENDDD